MDENIDFLAEAQELFPWFEWEVETQVEIEGEIPASSPLVEWITSMLPVIQESTPEDKLEALRLILS